MKRIILFLLLLLFIPMETNAIASKGVSYLNDKYNEGNNEDGLIIDDFDNLRFRGAEPNNYVIFNNEIWRIIGVFDVKKNTNSESEKRIKIIRDEPIGKYNWDYSTFSEQNSDFGISNWSTSDLAYELNNDYLNYNLNTNKNWYYNQTFNYNSVLKKDSQELIDDALWNLGGNKTDSRRTAENQYQEERNTKTCHDTNTCKDKNLTRSNTWIGKVGLIYPSDYVYASDDQTTEIYNCKNNVGYDYCKNNNWLYFRSFWWTMSPTTSFENVFSITEYGGVGYTDPANNFDIKPVVYLKEEILIDAGDGSKNNPYTIKLPSKNNIIVIDNDNGNFYIKKKNDIAEGTKILFKASPKEGYVLSAIELVDSDQNIIDYQKTNNNNEYTFIMPNQDVTIKPIYTKVEKASVPEIVKNPKTGTGISIIIIFMLIISSTTYIIFKRKKNYIMK